MISKIIAIITFITSLVTIAFLKGKKSEQTKQVKEENLKLKIDNKTLQNDIQLINKVSQLDSLDDALRGMSQRGKSRKSK